jgi:hypothetical protein
VRFDALRGERHELPWEGRCGLDTFQVSALRG